MPLALNESVGNAVQEMFQAGIIEPSISQYCNPLRIVMKSDGKPRICLDARQLNENIEDDLQSPPVISEIMQKFFNADKFLKIDLTNSYWQVKLHEDSRPLTAFKFDSKLYQWTRVPFGIKTVGSALIRAFDIALKNPLPENFEFLASDKQNENSDDRLLDITKNSITYVDDTAIGTNTFGKHIQVLQIIFHKLLQNNFTIEIAKSQFFRSNILFLGFILSQKGIEPNPEKISDIVNVEQPKNQKHLQTLFGICNYYRRFVIQHNNYITPFRDLLAKDGH